MHGFGIFMQPNLRASGGDNIVIFVILTQIGLETNKETSQIGGNVGISEFSF